METVHAWFAAHGLYRMRHGKMIAGVCAGIADRYTLPRWFVRAAFVATFLVPGPHLLLYLVLAFLMPVEGQYVMHDQQG